jgi:transposase
MSAYCTPKKLSDSQIAELRRRVAAGEVRTALAREYDISRETLYRYAGDIAAASSYRYHAPSKLTPQQAEELRRRVAAGEVRWRVAKDFGICISTSYSYTREATSAATV